MIHYNLDTDIRKKVLKFIFIFSILVSMCITNMIDYLKTVYSINISHTIVLLLNTLPFPSVFAIIYNLFDKCLWKTKLINILIGIPDLNGKWEGEYCSSFKCKSPDNCNCCFSDQCSLLNKGVLYNECLLKDFNSKCENYIDDGVKGDISFEIKQTFSRISIYSKQEKSTSKNRMTSMLLENVLNGEMTLLYEHFNEIDIFKADSNMKNHSGFNKLNYIKEDNQEILQGSYYNDPNRQTYGKVMYIKNKYK